MGVGRRMNKQADPPSLDEFLASRKRRDTGGRDDGRTGTKKRRTDTAATREVKRKPSAKPKNVSSSKTRAADIASTADKSKPKKKTARPAPAPEPESGSATAAESDADSAIGSDDEAALLEELDIERPTKDALGSDSDVDFAVGDNDEFFSGSEESVVDSDIEDYGAAKGNKKTIWSEDEEDDSDDDQGRLTASNIVGLSRRLDEQAEEEAADAEAEMQDAIQTNIMGDTVGVFSDSEDESGIPKIARMAPNLQIVRQRMTDNVRVLDKFSELAEPGRSRTDYMTKLVKDICIYYGYSEFLADKLFHLFPPREALAFFDANDTPRPIVIRTNTLRTSRRQLAQSLINRGVSLEPVGKWSKVGLQVFESPVPLGATPEYLAGQYMLQAAVSFLPVMALAPQEHERVLDMAAAPGGKTTYLASLMRNTGCVFANDPSKQRSKGLIGNIHRMGIRNTIVSNYDALAFPKVMGGFDRVLLDAPCSGTGVISKDASVKTNKTEADFLRLPHLQKRLLLAAIDSVDHASKTGGYIVYSTCSVTIEENEGVIQYVLSRRPNVKIVPTGLAFGKEGFASFRGKKFDAGMTHTRRYYPHVHNVDGFFVCKLKKTGPTPANAKMAEGSDSAALGKKRAASSRTDVFADGVDVADFEADAADKAPIVDEDAATAAEDGEDGSGFDSGEDAELIERGRKAYLRKRGRNPRADRSKSKKAAENE